MPKNRKLPSDAFDGGPTPYASSSCIETLARGLAETAQPRLLALLMPRLETPPPALRDCIQQPSDPRVCFPSPCKPHIPSRSNPVRRPEYWRMSVVPTFIVLTKSGDGHEFRQ
jgi:hypothetical protein